MHALTLLRPYTGCARLRSLCLRPLCLLACLQGGLSALVAHAHAPLMATGTSNQVVKVWTDSIEVVSPQGGRWGIKLKLKVLLHT